MPWVRKQYGVPVRLHQLVRAIDGPWAETGTVFVVRSCSNYVHVSPRDSHRTMILRFHPTEIEYKTDTGWFRP